MDRSTQQHALTLLKHTFEPISEYLDDNEIQEIMINGPDDVWIERRGVVQKTDKQISDIQIRSAISVLAKLERKEAREGTKDGMVDSRLDGMRVAAVLAPTAVKGHAISIRKHNPARLTLGDYATSGAFDVCTESESQAESDLYVRPTAAEIQNGSDGVEKLLRWIVKTRKNVIVAGATSSGKTTFLNAMIAEIDETDRVLTIEDTPELNVKVPNCVSLESNEQEGVTTRDLLRLALRFRPDRIIVGEVRGGEAYDLMQAANTGHDGCFATVHANSAYAALSRLETLVLTSGIQWPHEAIRSQIAGTFEYVVFMVRKNGKRRLEEIIEMDGFDGETGQYKVNFLFQRNE